MEHSGNIPIFNQNIIWELSPNIPRIYHGNVSRIFHKHIFARWVEINMCKL